MESVFGDIVDKVCESLVLSKIINHQRHRSWKRFKTTPLTKSHCESEHKEFHNFSSDSPSRQEIILSNPNIMTETKKVRNLPPDLIVAVGATMKEFQCHRIILSFASDYFDSMVSDPTKGIKNGRIEFPAQDPDSWELFYPCINPSSAVSVTSKTVQTLLPWFYEFKMDAYLQKCDEKMVSLATKSHSVSELLSIASLSSTCELANAFKAAHDKLKSVLNKRMLNSDPFEFKEAKVMASLSRRHDWMWNLVKQVIPRTAESKSKETVVNNDLFPDLILLGLEHERNRKRERTS